MRQLAAAAVCEQNILVFGDRQRARETTRQINGIGLHAISTRVMLSSARNLRR